MSAFLPTLRVMHQSDALVMAALGPVCVAVWRKQPTRASFDVQHALLESAVESNQGHAAFLCVIEDGTDPPEQKLREASAQMISSLKDELVGVACVVEGAGFRAAISRTVLSSIMLLARAMPPVRVFDSTESAAPWLSTRLGGLNMAGLAQSLALVRRG